MNGISTGNEEDWEMILRLLPVGWKEKARELGALRRCREFPDAAVLLRVLLIHLAEGCSLRETAVRAAEGKLVTVSDVALLKRLRVSGPWFRWIGEELMQRWVRVSGAESLFQGGRRLRVVDGSTVSEPGATGSTWRVHYSAQLPSLSCDEVHVTEISTGESLSRFTVASGDVLIADRGFANRKGVRHVHQHGGSVIVRMNLTTLPLVDANGKPFKFLPRLRRLRIGQCGDWQAWIAADPADAPIAGRVCAIKKSKAATHRAREQAQRDSAHGGHRIQPETLEAAAYILVFTTIADDVPASAILEFYRGRWQVEIAFKRLKSLLALGHLKKSDVDGAKAWLQGKLLVAILIETLISVAERFFPWGYPLETEAPALPLARDLTHVAPV